MTDNNQKQSYRGRFAPSPTGPLHFGSLIAATGSYLQAKTQQGEWLLRIDDIDPPREIPGAAEEIQRSLELFGFEWDGPVSYQSQHGDRYQAALEQLKQAGLIYPCSCTRKRIAESQPPGKEHIYPGTCRNGIAAGQQPRMLRINTHNATIHFQDGLQGNCHYELENETGDFVILRADGLFSYQLATGVDDVEQGITEVVRGSDLLDSTPCQLYIQQALNKHPLTYSHLPIALNKQGQKLSKQNLAPALNPQAANLQLWQALTFLGQKIPLELQNEPVSAIWQWAMSHWRFNQIPSQ